MDLVAISAALRIPLAPVQELRIPRPRVSPEGSSLRSALDVLDLAVAQQRQAEAAASIAGRPSLSAMASSASAVERAHAHVLAELRLITALVAPA